LTHKQKNLKVNKTAKKLTLFGKESYLLSEVNDTTSQCLSVSYSLK